MPIPGGPEWGLAWSAFCDVGHSATLWDIDAALVVCSAEFMEMSQDWTFAVEWDIGTPFWVVRGAGGGGGLKGLRKRPPGLARAVEFTGGIVAAC